jgi:hypothetical protein
MQSLSLSGEHPSASPPDQITPAAYRRWLGAIGSNISKFFDPVFAWHDEQLRSRLPPEVNADLNRLHVDVRRALDDTIALERSGGIGKGNTVGFEAYALVDVPISVALETVLFYSGKPVDEQRGDTYPRDTMFARSHWSIRDKWGAGNYHARSAQKRGGFSVDDLHDDHTILVRGNDAVGYTVFASFFGPTAGKSTATRAQIAVVMLNSSPDGVTEVRHAVRRNGQTYGAGKYCRSDFGFNVKRIRAFERLVSRSMVELNNTGRITENAS